MNCNIWSNEFNPFNKFKILCWHERMQKIETGNFSAPVNIAFDIIQGTNEKKLCGGIKCNFCMSNLDDKGKEAKVPREILLKIPKFWREWGVLSVCLAGHNSDPLMTKNDDFVDFIRLLNKNDIEAGINTNGYLLNERLIQDISRNCKWTGFSVNAGTDITHAKITNTEAKVFNKIIENIYQLNEYCNKYKVYHPVCYKYLITDENYTEIYTAIQLAKSIGCRQIQIRPCELPINRSEKIDFKIVEEQIKKGLELETENFEIFGIREKFTSDFKKITPYKCIASPLGSTWKADGDIVICPDRRWSAHLPDMKLGNYIIEGLESIRRKWGGKEHLAMIKAANDNIGSCIRCTSYWWHTIYKNIIENDYMDKKLI